MENRNPYLVPGAILGGCAMIAIGVYARPSAPPAPTGSPVPAAATNAPATSLPGQSLPPSPPDRTPAVVATLSPAADPSLATKKAVIDATKAVAAEKLASYLPKCWSPFVTKQPTPATSRHVLSLGFDAQGKEIGRGVNDLRGESRDDVSKCLRALPMGLKIPPPGVPVNVEVTLDFP